MHDSEGVRYSEPKIKMMGIEAVKSSTPAICREKITDAMKIMMNGTQEDMYEFIDSFRSEFLSLPVEQVAFPRGVNGMEKYRGARDLCIKGTPIHVRGSLLYNELLKQKKLTKKYSPIHNGDKIKFTYLKEPNPVKETVIAIIDKMPEEFELEKYIDYDTQFAKTFVDPLGIILNRIGWKIEKVSTLEHLFS